MTDEQKDDLDGLSDPSGDYVQQRRLEDIFDARQKAREKKLDAQEMRDIRGEPEVATSMYRAAIENYISECEQLTAEHPNSHYWENYHLGTVEVPPPSLDDREELVRPNEEIELEPTDSVELIPEEEARMLEFERSQQDYEVEVTTYEITGLRSILNLPRELTAEYTVETNGYFEHEKETRTVRKQIPMAVLENARRLCNLYLADVGIVAKPDDTMTDYEYRSGGWA